MGFFRDSALTHSETPRQATMLHVLIFLTILRAQRRPGLSSRRCIMHRQPVVINASLLAYAPTFNILTNMRSQACHGMELHQARSKSGSFGSAHYTYAGV